MCMCVCIYVCCNAAQCVQRCLDQLVTEGKLVEKTYGKQKTYVINQVHSDENQYEYNP